MTDIPTPDDLRAAWLDAHDGMCFTYYLVQEADEVTRKDGTCLFEYTFHRAPDDTYWQVGGTKEEGGEFILTNEVPGYMSGWSCKHDLVQRPEAITVYRVHPMRALPITAYERIAV